MPNEMSSRTTNQSNPAPKGGSSPLNYNSYLKVEELKSLQHCQSDPAHHDETLFIIIHQSYELWFKQILHEIDTVFELLEADRALKATFYLKRIVAIMKLLVQQIHILETMTPKDFLGFRYNLNPASGFQSSQFREIEFACGLKDERLLAHFEADSVAFKRLWERYAAPSLPESFYKVLKVRGFAIPVESTPPAKPELGSMQELLKEKALLRNAGHAVEEETDSLQEKRISELLKIYNDPEKYFDLHELAETLFDIDELIFLWRTHHVTVVERMIGFKRGTGGSEGVNYLRSTMTKRCFPDLWKLRTYLEL